MLTRGKAGRRPSSAESQAQRAPEPREGGAGPLADPLCRELVEAGPHGLLVHRDYLPLHVNPAFAAMLGFDSAQAVMEAGSLLERIAADDRAAIVARAQSLLEGGEAEGFVDVRLLRRDGTRVIVRSHARRIDWDGSTAVLETLGDVTELHRAREALEEQNARLRFAQRQARLTYWRWSFDEDRMTYWSEDWEGILGRPFDGTTLDYTEMARHIHADDWPRVIAAYRQADAARSPFSIDYRIERPDGEVRYVRETAEVEYDESGRAVAHTGVVQDVDEPRRTQLALAESEARYRAFVANSSEGIWRIELEPPMPVRQPVHVQIECMLDGARVAECNDVLARMHGFEHAGELVGRRLRDMLPPDNDTLRESLRVFIEAGYRLERTRYALRDADGRQRHLESLVTGVAEGDLLRTVWGTQADVTDLVGAEQARRASEQRFRDFAETAADWFWETDAQGRCEFLSDEFDARSGLRAAALLASGDGEGAAGGAPWGHLLGDASDPRAIKDVDVEYRDVDDERRIARVSAIPRVGGDGRFLGYRGSGMDVTVAVMLSERLAHQAAHDALTGLVGRGEFERRLARLLEGARAGDAGHALCYIDLDRFKMVNDACGHVAGDALLRQLGAVLGRHARQRDTLARLGGDEFALLLEDCTLEQARRVANELRLAVAGFLFAWEDRTFRLGASIGLVQVNAASGSASDVLREVDAACYAAKDEGRNRIHVHREGDNQLALRVGEMEWIARINRAIECDEFVLYRQPIVATETGAVATRWGELLLRMRDSDGELVLPGAFLPAAERYGLAVSIDRWVVEAAFTWLASTVTGADVDELHFINLSGQSLSDEEFLAFVSRCAARHESLLERVCFEITETAAIANLASASRFINTLGQQGCRFALDDFGSGLSSFAYLKNLPVDFIKIDGAFVRDLLADPIDLEMVRSINDIGHVMGKRTIAESVEAPETLAVLAEMGVDFAQGYGIARPAPIVDG